MASLSTCYKSEKHVLLGQALPTQLDFAVVESVTSKLCYCRFDSPSQETFQASCQRSKLRPYHDMSLSFETKTGDVSAVFLDVIQHRFDLYSNVQHGGYLRFIRTKRFSDSNQSSSSALPLCSWHHHNVKNRNLRR